MLPYPVLAPLKKNKLYYIYIVRPCDHYKLYSLSLNSHLDLILQVTMHLVVTISLSQCLSSKSSGSLSCKKKGK